MTTPLAEASTNVYTVRFDGTAIHILAKRRQKLLHRIPLTTLTAVEFTPSRGLSGGRLRFRSTSKPSARDKIVFNAGQQAGFEALAALLQRWVGASTDPSVPVVADTNRSAPYPRAVVGPNVGRVATALSKWQFRLESVSLILLLIPAVIVVLGVCWLGGVLLFD